MKLLGLRLSEHDSNISYFDGKEVKYFKSERIKNIKHHAYDELDTWKQEIKTIFDVDYKEIDEIAIVIDPYRHNLPMDQEGFFPAVLYNYLELDSKVYRVDHHYAHSLSTWMLEDKPSDISIVIDGFGDNDTTISVIKDNKILLNTFAKTQGSIGIEMADCGRKLGITASSGLDIAGKLMGLQSYGSIDKEYLDFLQKFDLFSVKELFNIEHWRSYKKHILLADMFIVNWITTVHFRVGQLLLELFKTYCNKNDFISFSGGVAQNVIWNTLLKDYFPNLIIPPHSGDEGLSLGAIEYLRIKNSLPKFKIKNFPYSQMDQAPKETVSNKTIKRAAKALAEGKIIAWYQGNGEIGARALGNRSILMDPRIINGKDKINSVKNRENYRPFGASILKEYSSKYFSYENPYMLYVTKTNKNEYDAITHIDGTCRLQTVDKNNEKFFKLMQEFNRLTGCPILLNTSLNLNGYPIAGTIEDAKSLFLNTNIDCLVIGDIFLEKKIIKEIKNNLI